MLSHGEPYALSDQTDPDTPYAHVFLYAVTRRCMSVPRWTLHQCIIHVSLNSLSKVLRCEQKYLNRSCLIVSECLEAIHVYIVVLKSRILLRWMLFPGSKYRSHTSKTAFFCICTMALLDLGITN